MRQENLVNHMGRQLNIITSLHQSTSRDYLKRMNDDKAHCMTVARNYDYEYWDGHRRYGYGGYRYIPGWWQPVAKELIQYYSLTNQSNVLDVGCGTGYLLYEMKQLLPELQISGFDKSDYGLSKAKAGIKENLFIHSANNPFPFSDQEFDLVMSLGCLHNLKLPQLQDAITEIERVGRQCYIMVESYRSIKELFNLQCWALTAESFFCLDEWKWIYSQCGYTGDYEFIYFE